MSKLFIDNPVAVPFGNPHYDVALGGSHDKTYSCPLNSEVIQLAAGTITDISEPSWGKQVTIELDEPIVVKNKNGKEHTHKYFAELHLSAINPDLHVGKHVDPNEVMGWSGGAVLSHQYDGTSNPTGQNFCDSADMSSQPQVGIALCDGPAYGGHGWAVFPPIDETLDPQIIVDDYNANYRPKQTEQPDIPRKRFETMWTSIISKADPTTGIANACYSSFQAGVNHGPPLSKEINSVDKDGNGVSWQIFSTGIAEWNHTNHTFTWIPFQ